MYTFPPPYTYHTITLISHWQNNAENSPSQASTVFEQELPCVQPGVRKGKGTIDQIANIYWIIEKAKEFQKTIYFCFIDYTKAFDCVDHNKLRKILKKLRIPDHFWLLRNLYAGEEATVRTGHGTTDWLQPGKMSMSKLYNFTLLI